MRLARTEPRVGIELGAVRKPPNIVQGTDLVPRWMQYAAPFVSIAAPDDGAEILGLARRGARRRSFSLHLPADVERAARESERDFFMACASRLGLVTGI